MSTAIIPPDVLNNDTIFTGNVQFNKAPGIPAGSITNAAVASTAAIDSTKVLHLMSLDSMLVVPATNVAAQTYSLGIMNGVTLALVDFRAYMNVHPTGSDTVVVDLQRSTAGGAFATVLSSTLTFNSSSTSLLSTSATLASTTAVTGDLWQVVVTIPVSNTTGKGLCVTLRYTSSNP